MDEFVDSLGDLHSISKEMQFLQQGPTTLVNSTEITWLEHYTGECKKLSTQIHQILEYGKSSEQVITDLLDIISTLQGIASDAAPDFNQHKAVVNHLIRLCNLLNQVIQNIQIIQNLTFDGTHIDIDPRNASFLHEQKYHQAVQSVVTLFSQVPTESGENPAKSEISQILQNAARILGNLRTQVIPNVLYIKRPKYMTALNQVAAKLIFPVRRLYWVMKHDYFRELLVETYETLSFKVNQTPLRQEVKLKELGIKGKEQAILRKLAQKLGLDARDNTLPKLDGPLPEVK